MRIVCSKCNTEYDIDLPRTALEGKHRSLKFRCSSCGYIFTTHLDAARGAGNGDEASGDASKGKGKTPAPAKGILLKQEGKTYSVRDLATLQRWIVERRVMRDDLVSIGGGAWEKVGDRPDLQSFLEVVDRADQTQEEGSEAWVSWDQADQPTEGAASENTGEILGALEADEDAAADGLQDEAEPTEEAEEDDSRMRDDMSAVLPPSAPKNDGAGIPAFPMGGALGRQDPLAMGSGRATGQTSRDQVFDAFPMDEVGEESATPSLPNVPASVAPAAPAAPSAPARSPEPVLPPTPAPLAVNPPLPPPPMPVLTSHTPVPVPMPMPVPMQAGPLPASGGAIAPGPRQSRELEWEDDRRGRGQGVNWTLIAVVLIVVVGVLVMLKLQPVVLVPQQVPVGTPPVAGQAPAATPAPETTAAAPTTPATTPAPAATPATPATSPEATTPAPATPEAAAPATQSSATAAPATSAGASVKSSGGGARSLAKQGWAALDRGDVAKARALCLDAVAADGDNADALYCVGLASEQQQDLYNATQYYCRARSLARDQATVNEINGILDRLGKQCG